jgi:serine/threonine protein kinase
MNKNENISKPELIKLISQGAYGCVFKNVDENQKKIQNLKQHQKKEEYIIKIQKKEETSENETLIGKKIMNIKNYKNYFAPIIQTEDIKIDVLDNKELEKCDIIHDNKDLNTEYESEKIKYIGKDTLLKYYMKLLSNDKFINVFIENHIILLEALEKLESAQIIHYDLKENNIMIQDTDKRPIIIDFGLSIDVTKPMENYFYSYYTEYAPWCIDIIFLSFMVNKVGKDWQTISIKSNNINLIINEFFENNPINVKLLIQDERNIWKTKLVNYFNQFVNKPWKTLYEELIKYRFTWDNYSIIVMYLFLFYELELKKYSSTEILNNYLELLKKNMMTTPNERTTPTILKKKILKLFKSINRNKLKNMKKLLVDQYSTKDGMQKIEKNMAMSIIDDKKNDQIVYKNQ